MRAGLARGALSTGFDMEEARECECGFNDAGGVVIHNEAAGPEPRPRRLHRVEVQRNVDFVSGDDGVGGPGEDGFELAPI